MQSFGSVPLEYALYQMARFQSNEDLLWCAENEEAVASRAMHRFVSQANGMESRRDEVHLSREIGGEEKVQSLENLQRCLEFDRALYYFSYPDAPMEKFFVEAIRERSGDVERPSSPIDAEMQRSWKEKKNTWYDDICSR
jgi:hypothetical protein